MIKLENVDLIKKANIYYDGCVTSRTAYIHGGEKITLGIILPGEYEFSTDEKEHMELLSGRVEVKMPGSEEWNTFESGETFEIPQHSKFMIKALELTDYCCSYIKR